MALHHSYKIHATFMQCKETPTNMTIGYLLSYTYILVHEGFVMPASQIVTSLKLPHDLSAPLHLLECRRANGLPLSRKLISDLRAFRYVGAYLPTGSLCLVLKLVLHTV